MRYLSVCSGIEAATCAWHHMGWKPEAFSEIEPFPSAVLAHHYPDTPNLGDMTKYKEWNLGAIDLLVGGTPCQSFSVAGLRKGLADPRGNLALVYLGIADLFKPKWIVWENVPGVLSSNGGRDFGSFLGALAQLGYGFAYRVLDAQWFGVAQRRKRVFVVGYLGDWRPAAAVLFESSSLSGNPKPSREKGEKPTGTLGSRASSGGGFSTDFECAGGLQPVPLDSTGFGQDAYTGRLVPSVVGALDCRLNAQRAQNAQAGHMVPVVSIQGNLIGREAGGPQGVGASDEGVMYTLTKADVHGVAQPIPLNSMTMQGRPSDDGRMGSGIRQPGDPCQTITKAHSHAVAQPVAFQSVDHGADATYDLSPTLRRHDPMAVMQSMAVRRLTPRECERLQGFRDDYTLIPWRGKEAPDGPRYKALGNSMAVPVMRWIGERIESLS